LPVSEGNCGNFATDRPFTVNGATRECGVGAGNWTAPDAVRGGYCFFAPAGETAGAYFTAW
jgi:hypothetical protein